MIWNKYLVEDRKMAGISAFALILIIVSIYMKSSLVLFLAVFFLAIARANQIYLKKAGNHLIFENIAERNRFFINEKGNWFLTFRNEGLPILKGDLRVYFDHFVGPECNDNESSHSLHEVFIPFSLLPKQTKRIVIPYTAKMRGIAKIRKIEFHIPSLIGYGETVLEYKYLIKQEAVVYPVPIPVKGLKEQLTFFQGGNAVPYSVYEDRMGPLGTRDYVPTDSFNRIHWKASARKQNLQTKVFERIAEKGWNLSINVSDGYGITGQLEQLLSSVTEFAYFAHSKQIPYSLCINIRTAGNTPFHFIPKGEGKEHLQRVLETLASISTQNPSFPYSKMLTFYKRHLTEQPFFIHGGVRTGDIDEMLFDFANGGTQMYELKVENTFGMISPFQAYRKKRRMQ